MAYTKDAIDAALKVRVDSLAEDVHGFRTDLREVRSAMATRQDIEAIALQITAIAAKQDTSGKPNWQAWGVAVSAIIALGTLAYWPILRSVDRLELAMVTAVNKLEIQSSEMAKHGEQVRYLEKRLDAISSRLAEFIRTGK